MATDIFKAPEKAQRFLLTEHPLLGARRPLDLTQASSAGAQAVEELLGRLKYGSAA
jgi:putative toxin-antitoxin system antitoxin component (TIGR02293 family)